MPRPRSVSKDDESEEEIIKRCPTVSFMTPEANKPVPIRPLKRLKGEDGAEEQEDGNASPGRREELSPRRLDMEQAVVLGSDALPNEDGGESDGEDEERIEPTQVLSENEASEEPEEGEIAPAPLVRCVATAL